MNIYQVLRLTNIFLALAFASAGVWGEVTLFAKELHISEAPYIDEAGTVHFESLEFGGMTIIAGLPSQLNFDSDDPPEQWLPYVIGGLRDFRGINSAGDMVAEWNNTIISISGTGAGSQRERKFAARYLATTAVGTISQSFYSPFGKDVRINSNGDIAFYSGLNGSSGTPATLDGIIVSTPTAEENNGSSLRLIAKYGDSIGDTGYTIVQFESTDFEFIGEDVYFLAHVFNEATGDSGVGIIKGNNEGLSFLYIIDENSVGVPELFYYRIPDVRELAVNNNGDIAFVATLLRRRDGGGSESGGNGLFYMASGSEPNLVRLEGQQAPNTTYAFNDFHNLNLNDNGNIAFIAGLKEEIGTPSGNVVLKAIFTGAPGAETHVVSEGQSIDGEVVAFLEMSQRAINNSKALVFKIGSGGLAITSFETPAVDPELRISQGVYVSEITPAWLVDQRTTAIIVDGVKDSEVDLSIIDISPGITPTPVFQTDDVFFDTGKDDSQIVFHCNQVINFCNLEDDKTYRIVITVNHDSASSLVQEVKVKSTRMLGLEFFFLSVMGCAFCDQNLGCQFCDVNSESIVQDAIDESVSFLERTYPVRDQGVFAPKTDAAEITIIESVNISNSQDSLIDYFSEVTGLSNQLGTSRLKRDLAMVEKKVNDSARHPIVFVPGSYLDNIGFGAGECGVEFAGYSFVDVADINLEPKQIVAHELGHALGLYTNKEAYEQNPGSEFGFFTEGYDVYASASSAEVSSALGFMGKCDAARNRTDNRYWVTATEWSDLHQELANDPVDPDIISVIADVHKSGKFELYGIGTGQGNILELPRHRSGGYSMSLEDKAGNEIASKQIKPDFSIEMQTLGGRFFSNVGFFVARMEYPLNTYSVVIKDPADEIIADFDPVTAAIADVFNDFKEGCIAQGETVTKDYLLSRVEHIDILAEADRAQEADAAVYFLEDVIEERLADSCLLPGTAFSNVEKFKIKVTERLTRFRERENLPRGTSDPDVDGDGIPNSWEATNGLNENDFNDATQDNDGDGRDNLREFLDGTNPFVSDGRATPIPINLFAILALAMITVFCAIRIIKRRTPP